jgi:flagellar hook-associated protein 2
MASSSLGTFGLNSGFDSTAIIEKMVQLNKRPLDLINAKKKIEQQKLTNFQDLRSRLQTFKGILVGMNTDSAFLSTQGSFFNSDTSSTNKVVDVVTSSQATSGTFSFAVTQLAKESKLVSAGFASANSIVPMGTLQITVGNQTTSVVVNGSNNTLAGLRLAISNSGADVTASFLDDGSATNPIRLLVSGTKTGLENSVSMNIETSVLGGIVPTMTFSETQAAQDATMSVNGIVVTKPSNTITDVLPNTTMTLLSTGGGTIKITSDTRKIKDKINNFVQGYNDLMGYLSQQLTVDTSKNTTGVLFGSFAVQDLQTTMRNTVSVEHTGVMGTYTSLSQIGIMTESNGILTVDDSKLSDALSKDVSNISQLFSSKGTINNNNVTFIGFLEKTQPGTYNLRVSGGVPQLSLQSEGIYTNVVGNGNFFEGARGTPAEGLNFRINSNVADGDYGTITLAIGVAETLNRTTANLTDLSRKGPLAAELATIQKTLDDFDQTIVDKQTRLALFEDNLRQRFSNLEVLIGKMNSQQQAFSNSLGGLASASGK